MRSDFKITKGLLVSRMQFFLIWGQNSLVRQGNFVVVPNFLNQCFYKFNLYFLVSNVNPHLLCFFEVDSQNNVTESFPSSCYNPCSCKSFLKNYVLEDIVPWMLALQIRLKNLKVKGSITSSVLNIKERVVLGPELVIELNSKQEGSLFQLQSRIV